MAMAVIFNGAKETANVLLLGAINANPLVDRFLKTGYRLSVGEDNE
jgi:hypothetical protein